MAFTLYYYTPSAAAAGIFVVLFGISTVLHFLQLVRTRTWFMIPFFIGGICQSPNPDHAELLLTLCFIFSGNNRICWPSAVIA